MHHDTNRSGQPVGEAVPGWIPPPLPSREPMVGRRCTLAPLDSNAHGKSLHTANALDAAEAMWTYLPYGPFATLESYLAWIDPSSLSADPLFYAVVDNGTSMALGVASYLRIDPRSGSIEVGHIAYSPLLQQTPAATEAMYLMMERAFDLGYRRYEWKCDALNVPSRTAAQRLGLSFEGIFRQALIVKGRNRDTAWYAAIDKEWPELKAAFVRWLDPVNFDEQGRQRLRLSELTRPILKHRD